MDPVANEVLSFWFRGIQDLNSIEESRVYVWFKSDSEFDQEIKAKFADKIEKAANGEFNHWKETPKGTLALVVLLDQFPRNVYRGEPESFKYDTAALEVCLEAIQKQIDQRLFPIERMFLYLPLEHSESLEMQNLMIEKCLEVKEATPTTITNVAQMWLDYAYRHKAVIERFGRFPARNSVLSRETSQEEGLFLSERPLGF
mgnify:FL=1